MTKLTPRRRDVRERLLALHEILDAMVTNVDYTQETQSIGGINMVQATDYDRDFLTNVRDALRAGDDLEDAVLGGVTTEEDEDENEGCVPEPDEDDLADFLRRISGAPVPSPRG